MGGLDSKIAGFIELYQILCVKESISPITMALVASQFMAQNLLTRTSNSNMKEQEPFLWLTQAPIQMGLNFSSALRKLNGWMASMWYLAKLPREWMLFVKWKNVALSQESPVRRLR